MFSFFQNDPFALQQGAAADQAASLAFLGSLVISGLLAGPAHAQTSYPMITHTTPVAVQRGKTTEVVVAGQMNFAGVYKALFQGSGIKAEIVPQPVPKAAP